MDEKDFKKLKGLMASAAPLIDELDRAANDISKRIQVIDWELKKKYGEYVWGTKPWPVGGGIQLPDGLETNFDEKVTLLHYGRCGNDEVFEVPTKYILDPNWEEKYLAQETAKYEAKKAEREAAQAQAAELKRQEDLATYERIKAEREGQ